MPNLKSNLLFAAIGAILGAFAFSKIGNKPEPPHAIEAKSEANSQSLAKCVVTKKTDSKGNVTETIEANTNSNNNASSEIKLNSESKNSIDIFAGAGLNNNLRGALALELVYNKHSFEAQSDLNKDHAMFYKYKVLEWH